MTDPRYHVFDPDDWSGSSYTTISQEDAFAAWRCNQRQVAEMTEYVPGQSVGKVYDMRPDFEAMLADERREARAWARHEQSYARAM